MLLLTVGFFFPLLDITYKHISTRATCNHRERNKSPNDALQEEQVWGWSTQRAWAGTHWTRQTQRREHQLSRVPVLLLLGMKPQFQRLVILGSPSIQLGHYNGLKMCQKQTYMSPYRIMRSLQDKLTQQMSHVHQEIRTLGNSDSSVTNHRTILLSFHKTAKPTSVEKTWSRNYEMPQMSTSHSS